MRVKLDENLDIRLASLFVTEGHDADTVIGENISGADTDRSIEKTFIEMMMKKSGEERIKMGLEMFELAKKSIVASILQEKSDLSETEMKIRILKRCYGDAITSEIEQGFREKAGSI